MSDETENGGGQSIPRTVFAVNPGGRRNVSGEVSQPQNRGVGMLEARSSRPGVNGLVDAAADLFDLVVYLRSQNTLVPIEPLRDKAVSMVNDFKKRALASGEDPRAVEAAHYAIAATVDDQVMSKPWAMDAGWQNRKVVDVLYGEVIGGEVFFQYLDNASKRPREFRPLIEFLYICISLGFRGMYRRGDNAALTELETRRREAFRTIEQSRGGAFSEALSVRWKGVNTLRRPVSELLPTWLMASLSAAAVAGLFVLFLYVVGDHVAESHARVLAMPPTEDGQRQTVQVRRLAKAVPVQVVKTRPARLECVQGFLADEITEGLIEVDEKAGNVRILLKGEGMFAPGEIEILPAYVSVLEQVAVALNDEPGDVRVEGHTDSSGLGSRLRAKFGDNVGLSEARAVAVKDLMAPWVQAIDRMTTSGFGETRPIADNTTTEGKARNRRVELVLVSSRDGSVTGSRCAEQAS